MAGCYGDSVEDRYYERMLDRYLNEPDEDDLDEEVDDWEPFPEEDEEYIGED